MSEWATYRLGDLSIDVSYGYTESANDQPVGPKFLRITDIRDGTINWETVPYCPINERDHIKNKLEIGDIVVARTGATTGITQIIKHNVDAVFASYLIRFRIDKMIANPFFVGFVLKSTIWNDYVSSIIGGSAQPGANAKQFSDFSFKLPDLPTQTIIAEILSSLDDKIELNNKINQELENLAQTLFKQWFIDFEFPNENGEPYKSSGGEMVDSELGEIPKGWVVKNLSQIIKLTGGGTPKRSESEYWNGNILWFSIQDAPEKSEIVVLDTKEKISIIGLKNSSTKLLSKGTTIITARGTVGRLAFVSTPMAMNQSCYGVVGAGNIPPIFNFLNLSKSVEKLKRNTHGAVFDTITTSTFDSIPTILPKNSILEDFENRLSPIFLNFENTAKENKYLKHLRDTLLPKLISGELEVNHTKN